MILACVDDLLFVSKIRSTAERLGIDVAFVRSLEEMQRNRVAAAPTLALVDMNVRSCDPLVVIGALKQRQPPAPRTIAFVSHVRADLVTAARQAGADEVLARSAFAANLVQILRGGSEE